MHTKRILMHMALIILVIELIAFVGLAADNLNTDDPGSVIEINDSDLNATTGKYPFFILDYYAPGCEPCEEMNSTIHELLGELRGQAVFGRINIANNSITAGRLGIEYFPAILVYDNGTLVHMETGYVLKSKLVEILKGIRPDLNMSMVNTGTPTIPSPQSINVTGAKAGSVIAEGNISFSPVGVDEPELPMLVNDSTIELSKDKYPLFVLMGFSDWCGYCKMMNFTIEELAGELKGQAAFGLINAEENSRTAGKYNITAFPRTLVFKDGELVRTLRGYYEKPSLLKALREIEPGLNVGQSGVSDDGGPASVSPGAQIAEIARSLTTDSPVTESDPALDYLDRVLAVTRNNEASGTTINIFIINECPKDKRI